MLRGLQSVAVGWVLAYKISHSTGIQIRVQTDHCGSLCYSSSPGLHKSSPTLRLSHLGAPTGLLGPARRRGGETIHSKPGFIYNHARQRRGRRHRIWEPRVLQARSALPPFPPPGPLRLEFAHSAAGKCYFAGKVSTGTARILAAAPGPLG